MPARAAPNAEMDAARATPKGAAGSKTAVIDEKSLGGPNKQRSLVTKKPLPSDDDITSSLDEVPDVRHEVGPLQEIVDNMLVNVGRSLNREVRKVQMNLMEANVVPGSREWTAVLRAFAFFLRDCGRDVHGQACQALYDGEGEAAADGGDDDVDEAACGAGVGGEDAVKSAAAVAADEDDGDDVEAGDACGDDDDLDGSLGYGGRARSTLQQKKESIALITKAYEQRRAAGSGGRGVV